MDLIEPLPLQDLERVERSPNAAVLAGAEVRTIFLGFDQMREELLYSNIKGKNPFKDVRVRKAFYHAIDIEAIRARLMRGLAKPTPLLISPELFEHSSRYRRLAYDPEAARRLLTEAGYPSGFEVGMDCPNDRYVNDGEICEAVAAMLSKIGVKVSLNVQPKARFFAKALQSGGYQVSFYLLGWRAIDSHIVLHEVHGCRSATGTLRGFANLGGYCNPKVDELADRILLEPDTKVRDAMIAEAYDITTSEVAYIPLHQQPIAWGVSKTVKVVQRADNSVLLYWAVKE